LKKGIKEEVTGYKGVYKKFAFTIYYILRDDTVTFMRFWIAEETQHGLINIYNNPIGKIKGQESNP